MLYLLHTFLSVEIPLGKAEGTGPLSVATGLVLGFGVLTTTTRPQSLAGTPSPAPSRCGPRLLVVLTTCPPFFFFLQNFYITWLFSLPLQSSSLRSTVGLLEMLSTRLEVLKIPTE